MRLIFAALLVVMCGVASAQAESGASPATEAQSPAASGGPDFLFGRPNAWIALSGTWLVPRAGGDLFTFVRDQLTLSPSDFRTPAFTTSFGVALPRRLEVVGDIEISKHAVPSEYRKYVKADRSSITQTTQFDQAALGAGVRYSAVRTWPDHQQIRVCAAADRAVRWRWCQLRALHLPAAWGICRFRRSLDLRSLLQVNRLVSRTACRRRSGPADLANVFPRCCGPVPHGRTRPSVEISKGLMGSISQDSRVRPV